MAYLKCVLVGIVTGLVATVIWAILRVVVVVLPAIAPSGSGGLTAVSGGVSGSAVILGVPQILLAGSVGFALGFYLMRRRQRARTAKR
jgi:hypothetical protein